MRGDTWEAVPAERRAVIDGQRHVLAYDEATGATVLEPWGQAVTPAEMEAHVRRLCADHQVALVIRSARRAYAAPDERAIYCPPIRSQVTYLTALHEIGHLIGPGRSARRIEQEVCAWEWAITAARCRITAATKRRIAAYLRSYVARYQAGYGYGAKQAWLPSATDRPDLLARLERLIGARWRQP